MPTAFLEVTAGRVWFQFQRRGRMVPAWISCSLIRSVAGPVDAPPLEMFRSNQAFVRALANSLYDGNEPVAVEDVPWIRAWTRMIVSHYA